MKKPLLLALVATPFLLMSGTANASWYDNSYTSGTTLLDPGASATMNRELKNAVKSDGKSLYDPTYGKQEWYDNSITRSISRADPLVSGAINNSMITMAKYVDPPTLNSVLGKDKKKKKSSTGNSAVTSTNASTAAAQAKAAAAAANEANAKAKAAQEEAKKKQEEAKKQQEDALKNINNYVNNLPSVDEATKKAQEEAAKKAAENKNGTASDPNAANGLSGGGAGGGGAGGGGGSGGGSGRSGGGASAGAGSGPAVDEASPCAKKVAAGYQQYAKREWYHQKELRMYPPYTNGVQPANASAGGSDPYCQDMNKVNAQTVSYKAVYTLGGEERKRQVYSNDRGDMFGY